MFPLVRCDLEDPIHRRCIAAAIAKMKTTRITYATEWSSWGYCTARLTTIASRERNLAAYMLQPPVATTLEPRQRTAPITTHISYTSADFYRENKERLEALLLLGTQPESL
ncbi:Uncharacterized protein HZ326_5276 [Fusarium oxysporum f. sp. albedinis]|nr:Uncharacterized protein HZ326_5276 [Fusarium oxysporum f. sp. albedinis]